jgi:phosphohistidine phosphatase
MKINFDIIVSSPLKRCMQTASFVGTEAGYEQKILASAALAPDATYPQFQKLLHECSAYEDVLLVGHNPNLTLFLGYLLSPMASRLGIGLDGTSGPIPVRLRKGSLARLSYSRGPATLQWLLDPRTVRSLYATSTTKSRSKTSRK